MDPKSGENRTNFIAKTAKTWYCFDSEGVGHKNFQLSYKHSTAGLINPNAFFAENNQAYSSSSASILGHGYVLRNSKGYYNIGFTKRDGKKNYKLAKKLPGQLKLIKTSQLANFKNGLVYDGKHTYCFDKNGNMIKGKTVSIGRYVYKLNSKGYLTSEKYK